MDNGDGVCGVTAFASVCSNAARLPNGRLLWNYRASKTGQNKSLALEPLDWMSRFLQPILPSGFARVRTFGWLHPAAKARGNRVWALLGQKPVLTPAEQQTWKLLLPPPPPGTTAAPLAAQTPAVPSRCAPTCPVPACRALSAPRGAGRCRWPMRLVGGWFAGQTPWLPPERPP